MEKSSVDFQLSKTLEYADKGGFQNTATIIMHAPGMNEFEEFSNLSQLVMRAFTDAQKMRGGTSEEEIIAAKEKMDESGIEPDEIKILLLASENVHFSKIANIFDALASKVCEVAEGVAFTRDMKRKMQINDYMNMICSYIANFISPSLL